MLLLHLKHWYAKDCVPPNAAAIASMQVRVTLLNGSCSVKLQPEVWQCVRSAKLLSDLGLNCATILPIIIYGSHFGYFFKMLHANSPKNDKRGAKSSIFNPAAIPVRIYSNPSAKV